MQKDPRKNNTYFADRSSVSKYLKDYAAAISTALGSVSEQELNRAQELIRKSFRIFVGGNGGSAAISDHLVCDFVKGTYSKNRAGLTVHSLVGHQALFSAIANDFGYEQTLSFQLEALSLQENDLVILISSSGNSPNIVEAANYANTKGAPVIGLTGFSGGALNSMADVKLHVDINNYGVVEDCHQALMHVLAQFHFLSTNE